MKIVDYYKTCLRLFSVQLHLLAIVIASIYELMPALDPQIAGMLPADKQARAIGAYAIIGLIVRLIKQKEK